MAEMEKTSREVFPVAKDGENRLGFHHDHSDTELVTWESGRMEVRFPMSIRLGCARAVKATNQCHGQLSHAPRRRTVPASQAPWTNDQKSLRGAEWGRDRQDRTGQDRR
ncbi:hypothetical protein PMIN07_012494 [Paraphaeosphaeria minitans]